MSEHLREAKEWLRQSRLATDEGKTVKEFLRLRLAVREILAHLEAQKSSETPGSETPSFEAIETPAETSYGSPTLLRRSFHVNPAGNHVQPVQQVISGWLNSIAFHGRDQVEVTLSIRTPKAATPPSGSPSQSTEAPTREASGHAGEKGLTIPRCQYEWLHTDNNWYRCTYAAMTDDDRCSLHARRSIFPDRLSSSTSTDIHAQGEGRA